MSDQDDFQKTVSCTAEREYNSKQPAFRKKSPSVVPLADDDFGANLEELWMGLAICQASEHEVSLGFALHDGTYCVDFKVNKLHWDLSTPKYRKAEDIVSHILNDVANYRREHLIKILGAGVEQELDKAAARLCPRLWAVLDIVPTVMTATLPEGFENCSIDMIDEVAESMARKCLGVFGPTKQPRLSLSFCNEVLVDSNGLCKIASMEDFERSVRPRTWRAATYYTDLMRERRIRIAFFSATPQGGGVALMRHALLRFLKLMGVPAEWYVPRQRPDIFRTTKNNHNILQGVDTTTEVREEKLDSVDEWVRSNANRFWLEKKGPLLPRVQDGADVIIVDDPQLPELVRIAKEQDPKRPVIFRSHIEVRDDLVEQEGSSAKKVWDHLWERIRLADVFVSHPVQAFVPPQIKMATVGWLPATTEWLDGLNKNMDTWDKQYYFQVLLQTCLNQGSPQLAYPERPYIAQIARFDPSKGIPDAIKSYAAFRTKHLTSCKAPEEAPQLIICGHSSVDDPDASRVYHETIELINSHYSHLKEDIVLVRIGPSDQMLNAIMSCASVVLQLSTREGFEVKISEALHRGNPVIACRTGGIPLQIEHWKSGFLVDKGDTDAVAEHLSQLLLDEGSTELYQQMSTYAKSHVSDEVHTVSNATSWCFLASALVGGDKASDGEMVRQEQHFRPDGQWLADLAIANLPEPVLEGLERDVPRLPRHLTT